MSTRTRIPITDELGADDDVRSAPESGRRDAEPPPGRGADDPPGGERPDDDESQAPESGNPDARPRHSDADVAGGEIEHLQAEKAALFEKLARVQADFTNSRRRLETDFQNRLAYANEGLVRALLPALDNFDRALAQDPAKTDAATLLKGLQLVRDNLMAALGAQGVETLSPNPGEAFDPERHQAVMQAASEHPAGTVHQTFQAGYALKSRVLRPAQVSVPQQ